MKKYNIVSLISILIVLICTVVILNEKSTEIEIIKPIITTLKQTVSSNGRIEQKKTNKIYPESSGYVEKFYVEVGQKVKKGDEIALFIKYEASNMDNISIPDGIDIQNYIDNYSDEYEKEVIIANTDGTITQLNSSADKTKPVAIISDLTDLYIKADINEAQISNVYVGQQVIVTGDGFEGFEYTGEVTYISPVAKQVSHTTYTETVVSVTIDIINADEKIRPGFSANVGIITQVSENALTVPHEALSYDENNKSCVYILKNGKIESNYVETGLMSTNLIEITSGIEDGDIIIKNPPENLKTVQVFKLR
ncbi:MAG: HlyD family efflux transporter periplasmic adaptor subunit [Ruminococcaceae bacterium]|nr:HlyD family efflux transporter periplasmic adaptor subunit [Oscillospiraceae bacterium]